MMRHAQIGHLRTKHFWSYHSWSGSPPFWLFLGCLVTVKLRRYSLASEMLQHRDDIKVPILQVIFLMERPPCVGRPTGKWPSRRRTTPCGHKRKRWNRPVNWTLSRGSEQNIRDMLWSRNIPQANYTYRRFQWWINRRQASFHPTCGCCDSSRWLDIWHYVNQCCSSGQVTRPLVCSRWRSGEKRRSDEGIHVVGLRCLPCLKVARPCKTQLASGSDCSTHPSGCL